MVDWNVEEIRTIAIFITAIISCLTFGDRLLEKLMKKPRLVFKIESASLIEDFPGELGIQINIEIKAQNGFFFLKDIELRNTKKQISQKAKIEVDIREYIQEDLIQKYLNEQKNNTTSEEKEKRKIDHFLYYKKCKSGNNYRIDDLGNPEIPDIRSDFQKAFMSLIQEQVYRESRYKVIAEKIPSLLNLRIDDQSIYSLSLFFHIYGSFDSSIKERERLPLKNWTILLKHSKGEIRKNPKIKAISYPQVKQIIDEGDAT